MKGRRGKGMRGKGRRGKVWGGKGRRGRGGEGGEEREGVEREGRRGNRSCHKIVDSSKWLASMVTLRAWPGARFPYACNLSMISMKRRNMM